MVATITHYLKKIDSLRLLAPTLLSTGLGARTTRTSNEQPDTIFEPRLGQYY